MPYEPIELRTERLLLRPIRLSDIDDVLVYATDEEWNRHLGLPRPYTRKDAEQFVARAILRDWDKTPQWGIVLAGRMVGAIGLTYRAPHAAELGYSIARPLWGNGYMTEAASAVRDYAFGNRALPRLFSYANTTNTGSWRVMEKIGMSREGLLRSHHVVHDQLCDAYIYGILRNEWEQRRASQ